MSAPAASTVRRIVVVAALLGLALAGLVLPAAAPAPARAQSAQEMEISHSCIAVRERIPNLTVWGSGWGGWLANGGRLTLEWHWGGEPTTPRPATVNPPSQAAGASFTLVFDATGISPAFSAFSLIASFPNGARTNVGSINLDIRNTCPTATTACLSEAGRPVIDAAVSGYDVKWGYEFFYQYRTAGQQGPFAGALGSDGAVHGQLRNLSQVANATITARIYQPPQGDTSPRYWFITFPAPICNPPPPTTTTSTPGSTTTTSSPNEGDETTTTTRPSSGTSTTAPGGPTTTIPGPAEVPLPPPTPGASLTLTPKLGPTGFVTGVRGTGFPPNAIVQLRWQPGVGTASAITGLDGTFTTRVLVLPNDRLGPRALVATSGGTTAYDAFLVLPSTVQPSGGQNVAQISRVRRFLKR